MSRVNLFKGINPYLNSLLQNSGTEAQPSLWSTFHSTHVNHIADFLNQQLPSNYTAYSEQSLQVRGIDWGGDVVYRRPRPDVTLFQRGQGMAQPSAVAAALPTWQASMSAVMEPSKRPIAVVIRATAGEMALGEVVARIELLSPSNKPGGVDARAYEDKRAEGLETGIPLIEIDYLHESPPTIPGIPVYPQDADAYPYLIAISDPRPSWEAGNVIVYGFGIDAPAPNVPIPLAQDDEIIFDFDAVYQHTFDSRRFENLLDYRQDPPRFQSYSRADQALIRQRAAEISDR